MNSGKKEKYISWKYGENEKYNPISTLIELYPEKKWDWYYISLNHNLKLKTVLKYLNLPWDWDAVSQNPNITLIDILGHPELPWE